jgi:hypothetical protein
MPNVSIHFALFTPTDIHFTFVDEVCLKLLKIFIKIIRDELFSNPPTPLIQGLFATVNLREHFPNNREFTRYIELFLLLVLEQIILHLYSLSNQAAYTDEALLTILDKISLMPIPGSPSHAHYTHALENLRRCIDNKNFGTLRITDVYLNNVISTDPTLFTKLGIIGNIFFRIQINNANMINIAMPGMTFTQEQQTAMFNNLGLFKSTSLNRTGIPQNSDILITCIDNSKIYNETVGWPVRLSPIVRQPTINSPVILQDGGVFQKGCAFQKGGAITTGAIVKINDDNKISIIAPIGTTTVRSKRKIFKVPAIRYTSINHTKRSARRSSRHTAKHTARHTARHTSSHK